MLDSHLHLRVTCCPKQSNIIISTYQDKIVTAMSLQSAISDMNSVSKLFAFISYTHTHSVSHSLLHSLTHACMHKHKNAMQIGQLIIWLIWFKKMKNVDHKNIKCLRGWTTLNEPFLLLQASNIQLGYFCIKNWHHELGKLQCFQKFSRKLVLTFILLLDANCKAT
jgi:hypothetical protein